MCLNNNCPNCGKLAGVPYLLVSDDAADILELIAFAARQRGWSVDTAPTAEEMLEKINQHCAEAHNCYDAVIGDIHYFNNPPGVTMDGISALREIRKKFPDLPFIFYSALLEPMNERQARNLGATTVAKDGEIEELLNTVEIVMCMKPTAWNGDERRREHSDCEQRRRRTDTPGLEVPPVLKRALARANAMRRAG